MRRLGGALLNLAVILALAAALAVWIATPWVGAFGALVLLGAWMLLTRRGRQAASVTAIGLGTLRDRLGSAAVVVVGIAGVVGVLVALLAMGEGYRDTLRRTGDTDTAIVMRGGSDSEVTSLLEHDAVVAISQAKGIMVDAAGKPMASPELVVAANLPVAGGAPDDVGSVQLRGVGEEAFAVRPNVRIVAGRRFRPGLHELIVGRGAQREFAGLDVGRQIELGSQPWRVVGIFASDDALESELWADANVVANIYRRGESRASVTVRLKNPQSFDAFKAALMTDPRLQVDVSTTLAYFSRQSASTAKIIRVVGITVGAIMAIGAVFGALNCMFAAISARAREIATLRAIGFRGLPVVVGVLVETMLLAFAGGVVGGAIAWLIFNGYTASTLAAGAVGQLSFSFRVTPALLWGGLKWALAIGLVGGAFPAVRAARLPVAVALREL
ncbi:MAG: ABC transporter permease [Gammaproteobacteria bacterium]|nr:ABC transporter permease [Gammaproteobacteria bacterium]